MRWTARGVGAVVEVDVVLAEVEAEDAGELGRGPGEFGGAG
ncbi:hypothetical protein ACQEWB_35295 [Streptomyces sp. CA-249302]